AAARRWAASPPTCSTIAGPTCPPAGASRAPRWWRWRPPRCSGWPRSTGSRLPACSASATCSARATTARGSIRTSCSRWASSWGASARPRWSASAPLLADGQALLGARHGFAGRGHSVAKRGDVAGDLVEPALDRLVRGPVPEPLVERAQPLLEPVDRVLDPLETLGHRAKPPRDPLHIGGGGDAERPHGGLLGVGRLLARIQGTRERGADHRVRYQLLDDLRECLLTLPRQTVLEALVARFVGHRPQRTGIGRRVRQKPAITGNPNPRVDPYPLLRSLGRGKNSSTFRWGELCGH